MTISQLLTAILLVGTGLGIAFLIARRKMQTEAEAKYTNSTRLQDIAQAQSEIKRLQTESTRETEGYQKAKEAYDAKWRRPNNSSKPSDGNNTSGSSGGNAS